MVGWLVGWWFQVGVCCFFASESWSYIEARRKRVVDHLETVPEMMALNHHTNPLSDPSWKLGLPLTTKNITIVSLSYKIQ